MFLPTQIPFFPLKLSNKGREEYSKIILFIPFHFIPFPPPKWGLRDNTHLWSKSNLCKCTLPLNFVYLETKSILYKEVFTIMSQGTNSWGNKQFYMI